MLTSVTAGIDKKGDFWISDSIGWKNLCFSDQLKQKRRTVIEKISRSQWNLEI